MFVFGPGFLIGTRTDIANSTPVNIGKANEFSLDFAFNQKELYGQYQFPLTVARGVAKVTGKVKAAVLSALAINNLMLGQTKATGQIMTVPEESGTIPAPSGPYTITVANSANFLTDLGVTFATTGLPLTKVASGPTTGQYSVSAGVYTFAAADASLGVKISYTYSLSGSGTKITINNLLLGDQPAVRLNYYSKYLQTGDIYNIQLNQVLLPKLSLGAKLEDFTMPEYDFSAFADASQVIGTLSFSEAS